MTLTHVQLCELMTGNLLFVDKPGVGGVTVEYLCLLPSP